MKRKIPKPLKLNPEKYSFEFEVVDSAEDDPDICTIRVYMNETEIISIINKNEAKRIGNWFTDLANSNILK